jgi:hypothetical protein
MLNGNTHSATADKKVTPPFWVDVGTTSLAPQRSPPVGADSISKWRQSRHQPPDRTFSHHNPRARERAKALSSSVSFQSKRL